MREKIETKIKCNFDSMLGLCVCVCVCVCVRERERERERERVGVWAQSTARFYIRAEYDQILTYLLVTLHTSHLTSTTIFLQRSYFKHTYTYKITHNFSTKPQPFPITIKIFLHTKFTSKHLMLYITYQSLSGSQTFSPDSHFRTVNTKISPQNISF